MTNGYASQIINVSSISGLLKSASGGQFAYAASKKAIVQVTLALIDVELLVDTIEAEHSHGEGVPTAQGSSKPDHGMSIWAVVSLS